MRWLIRSADGLLIRTVVPISVWLTQRGFPKSRQHLVSIFAAELLFVGCLLEWFRHTGFGALEAVYSVILGGALFLSFRVNLGRYRIDQRAEVRAMLTPRDIGDPVGRALGWGMIAFGVFGIGNRPTLLCNVFALTWAASYLVHYYVHLAPRFPPARQVREPAPRLAVDAA